MERTLILVKPDAFARGLTGEIVARFERKGLRIVALRHMTVTRELAERHYAEHAERPFFGELVDVHHLRADRCDGARGPGRRQGGAAGDRRNRPAGGRNRLDPGDFAVEVGQNMVHGSDSPESAAREAELFFGDS